MSILFYKSVELPIKLEDRENEDVELGNIHLHFDNENISAVASCIPSKVFLSGDSTCL